MREQPLERELFTKKSTISIRKPTLDLSPHHSSYLVQTEIGKDEDNHLQVKKGSSKY